MSNHPEQCPESLATPVSLSVDGSSCASPALPAPKFPSPSECSKWLMLFWFAGFSPAKIRRLLSKFFKLDSHKAYNVENIESTFRRLQVSANRSTGDYKTDPYMYYIMTSRKSSPFEFRQSAIRWLERNYPELVDETTGDTEIKEMNCWYSRWMEEVKLMKNCKAEEYRTRAAVFEEKLDDYAGHFDAKSHTAYLENNPSKPSRRAKSATPSPERKLPANRRSEDNTTTRWGDNIKVTNIQRPQLTLRTKMGQLLSRSKQEGTPTPSAAQHLDDLGFFAHRPTPSPNSVVEARTRTPSLQSSDSVSLSSGSLQTQSAR